MASSRCEVCSSTDNTMMLMLRGSGPVALCTVCMRKLYEDEAVVDAEKTSTHRDYAMRDNPTIEVIGRFQDAQAYALEVILARIEKMREGIDSTAES